jgi:hypothetical protein
MSAGTVFYTWPWLGFNVPLPVLFAEQEPTSPAWERVVPILERAEKRSAEAYKARIEKLRQFFKTRGDDGSEAFARDVLSLSGKWAMIKTTIRIEDAHAKYLANSFSEHLFTPNDLREALESTVRGYLIDLDAIENDLLVELRADISEADLARGTSPRCLVSDEAFKSELKRIADELAPSLYVDLNLSAARNLGSLVYVNIPTEIVTRIAAAMIAEAGIPTSFYGAGLVAGVATLGVAIVVAYVMDCIIDQVLRACGYDSERQIAHEVREAIQKIEERLIDGSAGAVYTYDRLCHAALHDGMTSVREASRKATDQMRRGGHLGLQWELHNLHETRKRLRHAAIRKFLVEGGNP